MEPSADRTDFTATVLNAFVVSGMSITEVGLKLIVAYAFGLDSDVHRGLEHVLGGHFSCGLLLFRRFVEWDGYFVGFCSVGLLALQRLVLVRVVGLVLL